MYVVAIHAVDDPKTFRETAQGVLAELPEGTTLHSAIPNEDGSRAVCLWESGSVDTVRGVVEGAVGHVSRNEYFEVNAENAVGLPSVAAAATSRPATRDRLVKSGRCGARFLDLVRSTGPGPGAW